jgi:hypothetical protein
MLLQAVVEGLVGVSWGAPCEHTTPTNLAVASFSRVVLIL